MENYNIALEEYYAKDDIISCNIVFDIDNVVVAEFPFNTHYIQNYHWHYACCKPKKDKNRDSFPRLFRKWMHGF